MEYKTSGLSPEEELELIRSYIPTANNLPKNLNTLRLMGLREADIRVIFKGEPLLVFEGIKNPFTGDKVLAGGTQITIDKKTTNAANRFSSIQDRQKNSLPSLFPKQNPHAT